MLTDKILVFQPQDLTSEDIFSSSLTALFPDDTRNQHGDPGAIVVYQSPRFGDVRLHVADPAAEESRRLFAHYLWNASVWLADAVSEERPDGLWRVTGESVIEVGAGTGLAGMLSALAGAREVVATDYPAAEILDTLKRNVDANFRDRTGVVKPTVQGHEWGVFDDAFARERKGAFTRILAADCLWMPWEHQSLARSLKHFLSKDEGARIYVVAGFHTGRSKMAPFFEVVTEEGLQVESIEEVDVEGNRRPWTSKRDGGAENISERKRWLAVAVLKHAGDSSSSRG